MINLCFLKGKVINKKDLKFVYNKNKKNLSKNHICIIMLELEIENKQVIYLKAYNEIAEFVYNNVNEGDNILVEGAIKDNIVEIEDIEKIS